MSFWIWSVTVFVLVVYLRRTYSKFTKYNVKHLTPFPFLGNTLRLLLRIDHFVENLNRSYMAFPGDDWKEMRSTLNPAFSTFKIRLMVPFIVEVVEQMMSALKSELQSSSDDYVDIEVTEVLNRCANDVFALCAFGIKMNSHIDKNNEFYLNGKKASQFTFKHLLIFFGVKNFPEIINRLKISYLTEDIRSFFRNVMTSIMKERKEQNIVKTDMIHMLMNAKKEWSDDDLAAQILGFLVAASGTLSNTMMFILYELAVNRDVQDKLVQEIREHSDDNGGKIDYDSIKRMKYLDMVISEVLRLWPVTVNIGRVCNEDYNMGRPNDEATQDYIVKKNEGIVISVWAIHRDPNHFPDPDRFDPERFSDQNKHNIKPFTYMPFGVGPKSCIGFKYALCVLKVMIYQVLLSMEVSPAARTLIPAKLAISHFSLIMKGGHWIRFKART